MDCTGLQCADLDLCIGEGTVRESFCSFFTRSGISSYGQRQVPSVEDVCGEDSTMKDSFFLFLFLFFVVDCLDFFFWHPIE